MLLAQLNLLAQLPEDSVYINPIKLVALLVAFAIWAYFAQWVDKDTVAVNTYRIMWNMTVVGCGAVGIILGLLIPNFLIGFLAYLGLILTVVVIYIIHRNGLVMPQDTICTMDHFKRLREQGFGNKKKKVKEVKERVRITGADRKVITIPEDEFEREQYRLTQDLIFDMFWRRAAVVDITPAGQATRISYQIDGIATEREGLIRSEGDAVVQYLKGIAGLNREERRKPQRGQIATVMGENRHDVIVQTAGSTAGEKLKLRVIGPEGSYKVGDLGFTPTQLTQVRKVMELRRGMILITGPATHGITTSIYSFVRSHDAFLQNIQMLEYEHEVDIENVTQRIHQQSEDNTFAADLQKIVRSDPDIVVFPEVREREAAALAGKAAAERAKVYVGLVADDVFGALRKWTARVGDRGIVAKGLVMIINQRLVRRLCNECKQPYKPDASMLRKLNMPTDAVLHRQPEPQFDKRGDPIICQACQGTGYSGRIGVFDVFVFDDEIRKVIRAARTIAEVKNYAMKQGGLGLQAQAMHKVLDGTTSIQEIVRVIRGENGGKAPADTAAKSKPKPKPAPQTGTEKPRT